MKRLLSTFTGGGGLDIGFAGEFTCLKKSVNPVLHPNWIAKDMGDWVELAGTDFEVIFANDIRPDARAAWVSYFQQFYADAAERYHIVSIVDLVKQARAGLFRFPDNVDVITGGFPCQDFSVAGKRNGFHSHRSHDGGLQAIDAPSVESRGQLYMWLREVISLVQPKMFIAENVKGLANMCDVKSVIEHDFADAANGGYLVIPTKVLNAADYGVPQSRQRILFYGFKRSALKPDAAVALSKTIVPDFYNPYPVQTHAFMISHGTNLMPFVTCADAFIGLDEPDCTGDPAQMKYSTAKYLGRKSQGQTEVRMDYVGPTIRSEHHGNIEFRRLSQAHGGTHISELKAGLQERRLTVRECARLQTFPDTYRCVMPGENQLPPVSASSAYRIIGNAVPCLLGYHIAKRLEEKWDIWFI